MFRVRHDWTAMCNNYCYLCKVVHCDEDASSYAGICSHKRPSHDVKMAWRNGSRNDELAMWDSLRQG